MTEFLQTYGIYLALGLALVMVVWRGKGGGCCGGGGHSHGDEKREGDDTQQPKGSCH